MNTQYKVKSPIILDGSLIGIICDCTDGKEYKLKISDAYYLIENGLIPDCEVVKDSEGNKHIYSEKSLSKLNYIDDTKYTLSCRLIQNGKVIGYRCVDEFGAVKKFKPSKFCDLASTGCITNVRAKLVNNRFALFGVGCKLSDIQVINF